ncbi:class I SAM-dependent methyltransferase [Microvirga guangxiensis]|uniref:Ubiquinone/menaquinone biosynthesis C-methylase UbiE n=1 Tax=Microvirga guangxiensis TaxID=549386 RepID=A0A1G5CIB1_9HYPH|nr:class I SAM-dependent methyltransferase [Microvirga guangxiensis]SCY02031.1 Ubiquinone/menaquinone biosynthesis C-methylase UbiE [Microvirga guangxiensis]
MSFKDHFSEKSGDYAAHRPTYPRALIEYLADMCRRTDVALDVGCGTGQLSVLLAERFRHVIATDASAQQIEKAQAHDRVEYRVAPAETSGLADASVDLITAAQAAHWFDLDAFYAEVRRVGKPGAVLALITYGVIQADQDVQPLIESFYKNVVGPYWPPERRHVEEGYRSFDFPLEEWPAPPLAIEVQWQASDLIGYVDTWSAVRGLEKAEGRQPIEQFGRNLRSLWGDPQQRRNIRFPLSLRIGRL